MSTFERLNNLIPSLTFASFFFLSVSAQAQTLDPISSIEFDKELFTKNELKCITKKNSIKYSLMEVYGSIELLELYLIHIQANMTKLQWSKKLNL